jgi:hypothetical protein
VGNIYLKISGKYKFEIGGKYKFENWWEYLKIQTKRTGMHLC